jgi:hypothetical protein
MVNKTAWLNDWTTPSSWLKLTLFSLIDHYYWTIRFEIRPFFSFIHTFSIVEYTINCRPLFLSCCGCNVTPPSMMSSLYSVLPTAGDCVLFILRRSALLAIIICGNETNKGKASYSIATLSYINQFVQFIRLSFSINKMMYKLVLLLITIFTS